MSKHPARKPSYKYMHVYLNQCLRMNMGKAMFSVLFYAILQMIVFTVGMVPLLPVASAEGSPSVSIISALLCIVLLLGMNVVKRMLSYGLTVIMARIVEKKRVTIGFLFYGFRNRPSRGFKAGVLYTVLYLFSMIVTGVLVIVFAAPFKELIEKIGFMQAMMVPAFVLLLLEYLLCLPFSFVWLILYGNQNISVRAAFAESFKLMSGRLPHFIGFMLYAGGRDLLTAVAVQLLFFVLPQGEDTASSLQLLVTVLSFVGLVCEYRTAVRFCIALPLYFYSLISVLRPAKESETEQIDTDEATQLVQALPAGQPDACDSCADPSEPSSDAEASE